DQPHQYSVPVYVVDFSGGSGSPTGLARACRGGGGPAGAGGANPPATLPPANPATSPAGKRPGTVGDSHQPFRSMRTGEDVRDSGARRTASSEMKPGIFRSKARRPSARASR